MCQTANSQARRGVFTGTVVRNDPLCVGHYSLTIRVESFPPSRAGQFVQLQCRGLDEQAPAREVPWPATGLPTATQPELLNREPTLRRPLSLAGRRDLASGAVELDIIYRAAGAGTTWLSELPTAGN